MVLFNTSNTDKMTCSELEQRATLFYNILKKIDNKIRAGIKLTKKDELNCVIIDECLTIRDLEIMTYSQISLFSAHEYCNIEDYYPSENYDPYEVV